MLRPLRNRAFVLLWLGRLLSLGADWLLIIALPFHVYALTHSALAMSLLYAVEIAPKVLGPVAGALADRWGRVPTMLACDGFRAAVVLGLLLVDGAGTVWIAYAVVVLLSAGDLLFGPSWQALIPSLVPGEALVGANALDMLANAVATLVGPALGGVLLATLGFPAAVLIDGASFLVSGGLILLSSGLAGARWRPDGGAALAGGLDRLRREVAEGLETVLSTPPVRAMLVTEAGAGLATGAVSGLLVPFVVTVLHGTSADFGVMASAQGAGALVGAVAAPALAAALRPRHLVAAGLAIAGVALVVVAQSHSVPWAVVGVAAAGGPVVLAAIAMETLLQTSVDERSLGRVLATWAAVGAICQALGAAVTGALEDGVGPVPVMVAAGVLLLLTAAAGYLLQAGVAARAAERTRR